MSLKKMNKIFFSLCFAVLAAGCASEYKWHSTVPVDMRTVSIPVMRNESEITELGSIMARQLGREFQREGTFEISAVEEAAIEVQGVIKKVEDSVSGYSRKIGMRYSSFDLKAEVEISVIDRKSGKVLIDNKKYTASATFSTGVGDVATAKRDASGRLAEDLARQVVGEILDMKYETKGVIKDEQ